MHFENTRLCFCYTDKQKLSAYDIIPADVFKYLSAFIPQGFAEADAVPLPLNLPQCGFEGLLLREGGLATCTLPRTELAGGQLHVFLISGKSTLLFRSVLAGDVAATLIYTTCLCTMHVWGSCASSRLTVGSETRADQDRDVHHSCPGARLHYQHDPVLPWAISRVASECGASPLGKPQFGHCRA